MKAQKLHFQRGQYGIQDAAYDHRAQRASRVGAFPVKAQHQRPQEDGFQAAEGQQVQPDYHLRRPPGREQQQDPQQERDAGGHAFKPLFVSRLIRPPVQVQIFDDRSGTLQKLGIDRRHNRRHRRGKEDPGGKGRKHFNHQRRDHQIRHG